VITWYKDSHPLLGSSSITFLNRGQIIDIESAQVSDAGIYKCVAINSAGATELFYSLQIHGKCCLPDSSWGWKMTNIFYKILVQIFNKSVIVIIM
jgi:hypothetical protein